MKALALLLAATLVGCESSGRLAPSTAGISVGHAWYNRDDPTWSGVVVTGSLGWVIAAGRETQESTWAIRDELGRQGRTLGRLYDETRKGNEMRTEELIQKGVIQEAGVGDGAETIVVDGGGNSFLDLLTDRSVGALGLPNFIWAGVLILLLGVARKYLGLPIPIPGFKPKPRRPK